MRSTLLAPALYGTLLVVVSGCNKGPGFGPTGGEGLRDLFEYNLVNATEQFSVNAAGGGTVQGAKGTVFEFPPNAFRTQSGAMVSGMVQVSVVEVLDIGDMIMTNTQTVGDDNGTTRLLKSGGSVMVKATQGGSELVLGPQGMRITVPGSSNDQDMGVFTANRAAGEDILWVEADNATITPAFQDSTETFIGYNLQVDSLQWINCDYFPFSTDNTTITAVTPSTLVNDSTQVWFAFTDLNAVAGSYASAPNTYSFGLVPVGLQGVAVGLTRNGTSYSSAFTTFTTAPNGRVGLSFQPTTLQAFEAAVEAL